MKALIASVLMILVSTFAFAGKQKGVMIMESFKYDFSTSSATSATAHTLGSFPRGAVIKDMWMVVSTPVSPSAMSIDVGNDADPDGYLGTIVGSDTVSGTVISASSNDSPLLWDASNDHYIPYRVLSADPNGVFEVEFDNDPTQGAFEVFVEYFLPEESAD